MDEANNTLNLTSIQGVVITPSAELMYIVGKEVNNSDAQGIQVIDVMTGKRVKYSTNSYGHFNFNYDASWNDVEEPEGITVWDLDDGRAPGISGQLHVISLDNDWPDDNDIVIKHYTHNICVDHAATGPIEIDKAGTPSNAYSNMIDAYNKAWDGSQLKIKAGNYPQKFTLSKRIRLIADGGTVRIGSQ